MRLTAKTVVDWNDDSAPAGITPKKVYVGPDPFGTGGFQVAVATARVAPSRTVLRNLFVARKGKTPTQLVVAVVHDKTVHLVGPDPQAQPIEMPAEQAERQLQSILSEPDVFAATERIAGFRKANDSTGVAGFTNSGLFASHHITSNVPNRPDWAELGNKASTLLDKRGRQLMEGLGFGIQPGPNDTMLLSIDGHPPRAVAVLLDDSEQFDAKAQRFQLSPVAFGLAVAAKQEVPWLVVLRKDQIRLYPGRDGVGVGSKGQSETFFEVDLATIDTEFAALLPLVFSAEALAADGSADELLSDSARFATELGKRLRERIYDEIVPPVAVEVADQLANRTGLQMDADGLATAYRVTLRILFRLLFQAYAEDRGLLPSGRNEGFDANSLKTNAQRLLDPEAGEFGDSSTLWFDLVQVWNAIDQGNPQWQIPAYNGGLFSTDDERSPEGALIKQIELPDRVLGPALKSLLIDITGDGVLGPVDFRSLSVREFGTIYEGLLESSLSLAEQDLTVNNAGAWVPAKDGDEIQAPAGTVYFHSASGERKATGSYFTPKVIVDHLIERSIVPVLSEHLSKIAGYLDNGDAAAAAREFFDFRVADLAMGSGHFLVAAVDKIEALMRDFLTAHDVPGVSEELLRLAQAAKDALGTDEVAKSEVDEVALLRRQVARRCIYGLDINPMSVELARLALWIHTFVPGLPMSNLDHGLVCANSLTGIGTIEAALDALQPGRAPGEATFFDEMLSEHLISSKTLLLDLANASEANKSEVELSARLLSEAREAAETARHIFDAAVAARTGRVEPAMVFSEEDLIAFINRPEIAEVAEELSPAHMPYLFPEVFLRSRPGFDVLLGNPPWEKLKVETHQWWGLRLPGLRSMPQAQRSKALAAFREARPDLEEEFVAEVTRTAELNAVIKSGPFPMGAGDLDLYQAFAWRNWQLLRDGGRFSLVLPRGAHSGSGLVRWRETILGAGQFSDVSFIVNSGRWAFDMEPRYAIGLTTVQKSGDPVVRWAGPFFSEKEFLKGAGDLAEVESEEFAGWSTGSVFPMIPNRKSAEVFQRMRECPRFDSNREDWDFQPLRELDASGDKRVFQFDVDSPKERIPVLAGASFNLWQPDFGDPYAYSDEEELRQHLLEKSRSSARNARSSLRGMKFELDNLPFDRPRIAFRDITRNTDSRTSIACLIPPKSATVHNAPAIVRRSGSVNAEAFLLAVMSSIPFDWNARRWVELHMTYEVLNSLPVPLFNSESPVCSRVSTISGRLAAVDERYSEWAAEVGVPVGSVKTEAEKDDLIAELDALVSLLYGLDEDQVEHVFATFHRGWNYQPRLEAVLAHYRNWKGQA